MTNSDGTTPTLAEVMEQHPQLNTVGIGAFDAHKKTPKQQAAEIAGDREVLLRNEHQVYEIVAWLKENVSPIQTPTQDSYSVKGLLERSVFGYITNGDLIAAALIAGYPYKYDPPNVLFGMSQRDLNLAKKNQ